MELLLSWPGIEINAQDDQVLSLNMITIVVLGTLPNKWYWLRSQHTVTTLYQGFTALHLACWRGGVRVVRRLLNSPGGSPTLVWFAFWPFYSWGYLDQFCFLRYSDEGEKHWGSHSPGGCNGVEERTRCQGFFWSPSSTFFHLIHLLPPSSTFFHLLPPNPPSSS